MLRLQMEQNAALQTFGSNVGEQVSEAIITLMQPTVDTLQRTITQYVTVAIEDQRAGMDKVVRYFLDGMNTSLGGVFTQLKNRTEELARWEKTMIENITSMMNGMGDTTRGLADAESAALRITGTMDGYTKALEELTSTQQTVIEGLRALIGDYRDLRSREEEYLKELSQAADAAAANTADSRRVADAVAAIAVDIQSGSAGNARELSQAGQQIARSADAIRELSGTVASDLDNAAQRLEDATAALNSGLTRNLRDSIAVMDDSIDRLTNCLNGVTASAGTISQTMKSLPKTISTMDADVKATSKSIDTELKVLLKAVSDTQKSLNRFTAELDRRAGL